MNYEEAFQALRDGDLKTAIPLLARAAQESAYSAEDLNHAYTLALYRAGERTRLADAAFEIGDALLEGRPAMALDYFQRAFIGGGLDAACLRYIGEIFEGWAVPKTQGRPAPPRIEKVAHVVGSVQADHAPARHLATLVESLKQQGVDSQVFTTEWDSSWFFNSNGAAHAQAQRLIPEAVVASVEGNFVDRAERVAAAIRQSGVETVFYHASFKEQITARVAAFRPGKIQVNVAHGIQMDADLFDGYIHLTRQGLAVGHHSTQPREWIPPASDIAERVRACPPDMRHLMGLESAETISATVGDLKHASDPAYLYVLAGLLKVFPKHFHVFAGTGEVKTVRAALHAEGVLPRVRFLGALPDLASLMSIADVYLCPFKRAEDIPVLDAMGAGVPVIAVKHAEDSIHNSAAEILGIPDLIAANDVTYLQIAQNLLRDGDSRKRHAAMVQSRFQSEFGPAHLGERYLQFLRKISS